MNKLVRYHKVAFTGLMQNEQGGEWCKWIDVEDLIMEHRLEELEMSDEYIRRKACYKSCFLRKLKVSLFINLVLLMLLIGV